MRTLAYRNRAESGRVFILALILLFMGGLIIPPLLGFVTTSLKAGQTYEGKMTEVYAADAGVEDANFKLLKDSPPVQDMEDGDSYSYNLPNSVNGLPVKVNINKLSLLQGLLSEDEFKIGQPHEGWLQFDMPPKDIVRDYSAGWVEYYCELTFQYDGTGKRSVEAVGAFFSPFPGDESLIEGPYEVTTAPIITLDYLESTETKVASGGFAFIWRWQDSKGPVFDKDNKSGTLSFKFKVHDPDWTQTSCFVFASFKEQDVSYVTNANFSKWLIDSTAGDTMIRSCVLQDTEVLNVLTWEIDPVMMLD